LAPRRELHEQIDIAVGSGLAAQNRPEQRETLDSERPDLGCRRREPSDQLVSIELR
jgi:hypothetical protein